MMTTLASFIFLVILVFVLVSVIKGAPFVASDAKSISRMLSISKMKTPPARRLGVSSSEAVLPRLHRGGGSSASAETGSIRLAADGIKKGEKVIDLGSGDGRLMIAFAKKGCSVEGVEINPILVLISKIWIRKAGLKDKAKVRLGNMWSADLSSYDIILIFGMNHFMLDLEKKVLKEARNSAKIITHSCKFPFLVPTKRLKNVNLYVINDRELKH